MNCFWIRSGSNHHESRMNWIGQRPCPHHQRREGSAGTPAGAGTDGFAGRRVIRLKMRYTITDPAVLREHLMIVRERGYAVSQDECLIGFSSVAAPIFTEAVITSPSSPCRG